MRLRKDILDAAMSKAFLGGAALRREDAQKSAELLALLDEIDRLASRMAAPSAGAPFVVVDACAGKAALGVLASALVFRGEREHRVIAIEREAARRERAAGAAAALDVAGCVSFVVGDVGDTRGWPREPPADLVVALHACGGASDAVIDAVIETGARALLLVPCCYGAGPRHDGTVLGVRAQPLADAWAARVPLPRHALVGKRFGAAVVDAERTLRLEAAGYETEVVEVFAPTVSPHNVLWRARRVREPTRMARARAQLAALSEPAPAVSS